jgi:hypothetical protein
MNTDNRKRIAWGSILLVAIAAIWSTQAMAAEAKPCSANGVVRELDYWLGSWTVTNSGSGQTGTSKVELSLDRCLFVERWDNGNGHIGEDLLAYSPDDKSWHGMFADNEGRVHLFTSGKVEAGSGQFEGPSHGPKGEAVLNRVKLTRLSPDKLEQTWEKSTDNGNSWNTVYRGQYARTNP